VFRRLEPASPNKDTGPVTEEEMKRRLKEFALRVIRLARALPDTPEARVIRYQLLKAGTSPGANYRAACRGRSKAEFIAKLGIVEEEADESVYWMELITEAGLLRKGLVQSLLDEANEIVAMITKSRMTASRPSARKTAKES